MKFLSAINKKLRTGALFYIRTFLDMILFPGTFSYLKFKISIPFKTYNLY